MLVVFSLLCVAACSRVGSSSHSKYNWKAEDYFRNDKVVSLCKAIEANNLKEMERLIKEGADVNLNGKGNMTPLLWAFPDNKPERMKVLLKAGADPNVSVDDAIGSVKGQIEPGDSVTFLAAKFATPEILDEVLKHGGQSNLVHPESKKTLVETVVDFGNEKEQKLTVLLRHGADIDLPSAGVPPVLTACKTGQYDLVLFMLENGADSQQTETKHPARLVHYVFRQTERAKTHITPKKAPSLQKLVTWMQTHGESLQQAEKDWQKWSDWSLTPHEEYRKLMDAEIAAWNAKCAVKTMKNTKGTEAKP